MSTERQLGWFLAFIDFVEDQDPKRKIDHFNWDTCAVGDFAAEELGLDRVSIIDFNEPGFREDFSYALPPAVLNGLNWAGALEYNRGKKDCIPLPDYGALQDLLAKHDPRDED